MSKLVRILSAVDFSEPARAAFDHALALGRLHDAELTVVHAVPPERPFNWQARERIALIGSLREAAHTAGVRFNVRIQHGDPAGVILLHAKDRLADLIVLGSSERSGLDRLRFGSVAETVALEAAQPVLVVPPVSGKTGASATPFTNILVAVDLGDSSTAAVETALAMANGNSRVTLMHVIPGVPMGAPRYMYHLMEPEYQRQLARDAWRRIAEIVPADATASQRVHARVVTGDPAETISRVAAEAGADLILMGVRARGAIGRLVFGSTAARVIRSAGRPVLAVPQQFANAAAIAVRADDRLAIAA